MHDVDENPGQFINQPIGSLVPENNTDLMDETDDSEASDLAPVLGQHLDPAPAEMVQQQEENLETPKQASKQNNKKQPPKGPKKRRQTRPRKSPVKNLADVNNLIPYTDAKLLRCYNGNSTKYQHSIM